MASITPLAFSPSSVSGCQLWLDSADPTTLSYSSAANVTQWNDKSGNGRNAVFSLSNYATRTSVNSGLYFSNSYYTTTYTADPTNETMFIAFRSQSSSNRIMLSSPNPNGRFVGIPDTGITPSYSVGFGKDAVTWGATLPITSNANVLTTVQFSSGSYSRISVNGGSFSNYSALSFTSGSNTNIGGALSGGSLVIPYSGFIYEIIAYNSVLSSNNMQSVEGYLAWKWGLQGSLPTTHPYYYAAPNSQNLVYPPALKIPAPIQSFAATSAPIVLFNPKSFGNLAVWLDAADTTTITTSGSNITEWRDKSGNGYTGSSSAGRNFTYATSVQNTLNVAQTATGQTLSLTNVTLGPTLSAFLLCYPLNQSSDTAFLEHGPDTNTNAGFFLHTQNSSQIGIRNTSGYVTTSAYPNYTLSNTWQLPTLVNPDPNASSQASFYLNGSLKFSLTGVTGSNVTQTLFLNGRNNTNTLSYASYIGELLVYTAALTNTQRQQVEGYLAWKWGIQSTLPSDHLYKNTVPGPIGISISTRSMGQTNFSPARVSGCLMWLDANDINGTGVNPALGTTFTSWTDKSGSGNTVIGAASSTLSNYSGRNAVYMNATSFTKSATFAVGNTTMFLVFAVSAAQNDKPYLTIGSGANSGSGDCTVLFCDANVTKPGGSPLGRLYYGSGGGTQLQISYGTATAADVIPYCIQSFTISSTPVVTNYLNGFANAQKTGSVARVSVSNATVGGSLIWYLSEFIMYNSVLSDSTRQQIEGYLAWKWNLQGSIPRTSPFFKIPPLPN